MPRCEMCGEWPDCPWKTDPEILCGEFHPKPMTNAMKIRSMTDEELAHLLHSAEEHLFTGNLWNYEKWTEWLKQEKSE